MNHSLRFVLMSVAILAATAASASDDGQVGPRFAAPTPVARDGDWLGTLTLPSQARLRIAVDLRVGRDGIVRGFFDSLDQRIWNVRLDAVAMTPTTLDFTVPSIGTPYTGRWDVRTRRWVGTWSQGLRQSRYDPVPVSRPIFLFRAAEAITAINARRDCGGRSRRAIV